MGTVTEEFTVAAVRGRRILVDDLALGSVRARAAATRQYVDANVEHWDRHGFGIYVLGGLDGGGLVGRAGLRHVTVAGHPEIEAAFALRSEFWGRGLVGVVTEELVRVAARVGLCSELVAFTLATNRRSWRVMEKAGFVSEREIDDGGSPHVLCRRRLRDL